MGLERDGAGSTPINDTNIGIQISNKNNDAKIQPSLIKVAFSLLKN